MKKLIIFIMILSTTMIFAGDNTEDTAQDFQTVTKSGISFSWRVNGDNLDMKLSAECSGWISAGIDPTNKMKDADIWIFYVKRGKVFSQDNYGNTPVAHKSDDKLGGKQNIINVSGSEKNGVTEISYSVPLDSGDKYDSKITRGKHTVILGFSKKDDFKSLHKVRTSVEIEIK